MNRKDKDEITVFLGEGSSFSGDIKSAGGIRIDGYLKGNISAKGHLVVGSTGRVESERIDVEEATVAGWVSAEISAPRRVCLKSTAHFTGTIKTRSLVIEEGAFFSGHSAQEQGKDDK